MSRLDQVSQREYDGSQRDYETVTLERLKFTLQTAISKELLTELASDALQLEMISEVMADNAIAKIRLKIFSQKLETLRWPANWWEAVKERFLPGRMKQRWPVHYEVRDVHALYPGLSLPHEQHYLHILRSTEP